MGTITLKVFSCILPKFVLRGPNNHFSDNVNNGGLLLSYVFLVCLKFEFCNRRHYHDYDGSLQRLLAAQLCNSLLI